MSNNYSEEYFREILMEDIYPSLHENRLDLNNISVKKSNTISAEDLSWAIQMMVENGLLLQIDDLNYSLTEFGQEYIEGLQALLPEPAAKPLQAQSLTESASSAAANSTIPEFEDREAALNHLIFEAFIYNKTLELTSFGPLILRDHKPQIYGKYKFTKEEIDCELASKARQGILFFREVEEDGLDGGQDSYRIPPKNENFNPEDYIPDGIRDLYIKLRDDFAASEALEKRLVNTEMRSQYRAERSELFLMTELPLDTERSQKIMDKFIVIASFAETLPGHLQKEYLARTTRLIREYYKPNYLLTNEDRAQNEAERTRIIDELNQHYSKLRHDFIAEQERRKEQDEDLKKHSFKYKMSHTFHDLTSILSKTGKHHSEDTK